MDVTPLPCCLIFSKFQIILNLLLRMSLRLAPTVTLNTPLSVLSDGSGQCNVLMYVVGYVAYEYLKHHDCADCKMLLLGNTTEHFATSSILLAHKAFNLDVSDHGDLCMPSSELFKLI